MNIFEFNDYKTYLNAWIAQRPKKGRGELRKIAELLRVHSTMVSHVLRGNAHFSLEQIVEVAQHIGLSEMETDFLLELLQHERAGTTKLKSKISGRIEALRKRALSLKERLSQQEKRTLSNEDITIFYSGWHYSAIRLLATLRRVDRPTIAKTLGLSTKQVNDALEFLIRNQICNLRDDGTIEALPSITHLGADSPNVWKHHQNWRIRAMGRYFDLEDEEIMYSAPLTISLKNMAVFREKIVTLVEELKRLVEQDDPDSIACLNIDWFKVIL